MNYKDTIISALDILKQKELQDGNNFKAIAYSKVIQQIKSKESIMSMEDLKDIKGIGESIRHKIEEIFETGKLKVAEDVKKDPSLDQITTFMNVYGIGRVKAVKLVKEQNIHTIAELRNAIQQNKKLLNTNQTIGLTYYEDLLERIPRAEMKTHERILKTNIQQVNKALEIELVGSYRRGEPNSGDIDVLIKWPMTASMEEGKHTLQQIVDQLTSDGYIIENLAQGDKKCMAISKVPGGKARRLDLLLTPEQEYGFAIMYFTGSDKFNVAIRKHALDKGYSMNEHGFTPKEGIPPAPLLLSEKDIFQFLGYEYIDPKDRKPGLKLNRYLLKIS